jgi:hypothetical protein
LWRAYIILRCSWCDIIVLNIHAPTEDSIYVIKDSVFETLECVFPIFPRCHIKILLDLSAKVGREAVFKPTI